MQIAKTIIGYLFFHLLLFTYLFQLHVASSEYSCPMGRAPKLNCEQEITTVVFYSYSITNSHQEQFRMGLHASDYINHIHGNFRMLKIVKKIILDQRYINF